MKCPKCGQEFEGHPSECPACHVKFVFKKKEEEKITFDESGNAINSEQINEDADKPPKSDEEIKKEIIEKHKNEFMIMIKLGSFTEIFGWPFFIAMFGTFLPKLFGSLINMSTGASAEDAAGLIVGAAGVGIINIISWIIVGVLSIIYLIRFIICLRNICSKSRQQIIMNKQYENYKRRGKDGVRRFYVGKGKYIYLIITSATGFCALPTLYGLFTFLPMTAFLTITDFIILLVCSLLSEIVATIRLVKYFKLQNKIIITMYPEYKQYEW